MKLGFGAWHLFVKTKCCVFVVIHGPLDEPNAKNRGFMNNPGLVVGKNEFFCYNIKM
jgi:hypothetical protein